MWSAICRGGHVAKKLVTASVPDGGYPQFRQKKKTKEDIIFIIIIRLKCTYVFLEFSYGIKILPNFFNFVQIISFVKIYLKIDFFKLLATINNNN